MRIVRMKQRDRHSPRGFLDPNHRHLWRRPVMYASALALVGIAVSLFCLSSLLNVMPHTERGEAPGPTHITGWAQITGSETSANMVFTAWWKVPEMAFWACAVAAVIVSLLAYRVEPGNLPRGAIVLGLIALVLGWWACLRQYLTEPV